jgi:hypothetical protein
MGVTQGTIKDKVAALGDLPREELAALWHKNFDCPPPKGVHRELLVRAAAFSLQQKHYGGLSGNAKRLLKAAMRETAKTLTAKSSPHGAGTVRAGGQVVAAPAARKERAAVSTGARLIRDWNGRSHVVDVVDGGFIYAGTRYRSLSKIAREITGTQWSGPRFFGL